jgi:hypothetical protein
MLAAILAVGCATPTTSGPGLEDDLNSAAGEAEMLLQKGNAEGALMRVEETRGQVEALRRLTDAEREALRELERREYVRDLLAEARAHLAADRNREALAAAETALGMDPGNAEANELIRRVAQAMASAPEPAPATEAAPAPKPEPGLTVVNVVIFRGLTAGDFAKVSELLAGHEGITAVRPTPTEPGRHGLEIIGTLEATELAAILRGIERPKLEVVSIDPDRHAVWVKGAEPVF